MDVEAISRIQLATRRMEYFVAWQPEKSIVLALMHGTDKKGELNL